MTELEYGARGVESARTSPELGFSFERVPLAVTALLIEQAAVYADNHETDSTAIDLHVLSDVLSVDGRELGATWEEYAQTHAAYRAVKEGHHAPIGLVEEFKEVVNELGDIAIERAEDAIIAAQGVIERYPKAFYKAGADEVSIKAVSLQWKQPVPEVPPLDVPATVYVTWSDDTITSIEHTLDVRVDITALSHQVLETVKEHLRSEGFVLPVAAQSDV